MPNWKRRRLQNYDYSTPGAYFVTICTKNKENMFWEKDSYKDNEEYRLTEYGETVKKEFEKLTEKYPYVSVDNYVIMPNHLHMIIVLQKRYVNLSTIINQTKGKISRIIGFSLWQSSFNEHIIRDEKDYETRWNYICDNPRRWNEDKYYLAK